MCPGCSACPGGAAPGRPSRRARGRCLKPVVVVNGSAPAAPDRYVCGMTFDDNAKIGGGKVSKRGRNVGIGVGGGIGVIAIVLIGQLLGVDLSGLVGAGGGG